MKKMKEETTKEMSEERKDTYLTSPMTGYVQHTSPIIPNIALF
jgi:hypothetical protein